jgi:hypothetical protein
MVSLRKRCTLSGLALGDAGPNAVLCKTCSVLLYVLEQPRVDNFSTGPIGPISLRAAISCMKSVFVFKVYCDFHVLNTTIGAYHH